ncbi:SlyX family protein [Novipirellula artificiosorum]|uniref:Protein SlyX n=1 Tax=Novipirellula artificiosorum TaxID=2528016 RepID=A0A5C6E144_9BACT|nr:SlyX family protein [Novipirellula artificiosorum]TWU42602.1 hypothetical protein Poly41_09000 [Novipirellula artificiosorum]
MSSETELSERLVELEIHIAHVQRVCDQLNEVVTEQAMRQDRMQNAIKQLTEKMKEMKSVEEPAEDPLDEKPPHY